MPKPKTNSLHLDFTFQSLELIYNDMVRFLDDNPDKNKDVLIERIRQMTEFQIWGEKNNDSFFEFFCEKNILEVMLNLLNKVKSREIIVQIIQSLSMYLTNIKNPVNINFILSNNSINEFITHNFDFSDDEVVDYYISFLKSLSLRMETIPLELFYNKKYKDFPLMSQAIKFYNHPGSMVRTSVQNITLTLFQLKCAKLDNYLTNFPFATYFVNLACYLKNMWIKIDETLLDPNAKNASRLQELLDDQYDLLMYMEDIFKLKKDRINKILGNALLSHVIIPTLLGPLASNSQGPISLNLSLYLLHLMFSSITYTPILEFIFIFLFSSKLTNGLLALRQLTPDTPASYCHKWSFKTPWDSYPDVLYKKYMELLDSTIGNYDSIEIDLEALKAQAQKGNINIEDEYRSLARYIGVVTEPSNIELNELTKFAPIYLLEEFKAHFSIKGDVVNSISLNSNPVKINFLSFLLSRDDNMIMLMCSILDSALLPASSQYYVPTKTFSICNLMFEKAPVLSQPDSALFKGEIQRRNETCKCLLDCLYKLLTVDPPFRIVTMRLITKLIMDLSVSTNEQVMISGENLVGFNTGYKNSIVAILKFLQNSIVGDLFSELFDTQWKEIYKQNFVKPKRRDYVYMLLPPIEEAQPGLDPSMRLPVSEIEIAKREIAVFLLYRRIRYSLITISRYSTNFIENYRPSSGKEIRSNVWEEGKLYEIDQRKLHQCQLKEQGSKQVCYIAEDEENFILIAPDPTRLHWAKIMINSKLKDTEALQDRANSSQLIITARLKDKYYQKTLLFSDKAKCFEAKKAIDDNRRYLKHYDMTILLKHFENAKNDIYEAGLIEF